MVQMKKYIVLFFLCFIVKLHADPHCIVIRHHERGLDGERFERLADRRQINRNYYGNTYYGNTEYGTYVRRMRALEQERRLRAIREYNLMIRRYNNQLLQNRIIQIPRRRCLNN
jgi:hypothetical protein